MPTSSDTAFLTLTKSFTYRGNREEWANVYHFDNVPPSTTVWDALTSQVWFFESVFLDGDVQAERVTGHTPGTPPVLVYESEYPPPGEGGAAGAFIPTAGEFQTPGDVAAWVRWGTTQKNSLGKPIYLRNYYHQCYVTSDGDTLATRYRDGIAALGQGLQTGVDVSGITYRRAGPRGAVAQNHQASSYAGYRQLKSRGRRHRITKAELAAALEAGARRSDVPVNVPIFP